MSKTVFSLLFPLLILRSASLISQVPTAGLIGAWEFSGNANDISSMNNHGSVSGPVLVADRCGIAASAYYFDGVNDHITMLNAGPTGNAPRSVSFWARTSQNYLMTSFGYGGAGQGTAFALQYNYNCIGIGLDVNNQAFTKGATCIIDNKWHHIVGILDPSLGSQISNFIIYVDGQLVSPITCIITGTTQTYNTNAAYPVCIGKIQDDMARFFKGDMDDIYLYDRVLTQAEVLQLYNVCQPAILGATAVCKGSSNTYSLNANLVGSSYTWSVPSGWTGASTSTAVTTLAGIGGGVVSMTALSSCGGQLAATKQVSVLDCVGYSETIETNVIETYPNPSAGELTLRLNQACEIFLFDFLGNVVARSVGHEGENRLDLHTFDEGTYFILIKDNDKIRRQKICIAK